MITRRKNLKIMEAVICEINVEASNFFIFIPTIYPGGQKGATTAGEG